jgi:hypothetical protein
MERKVINIKPGLIEYKGDFYTSEELAAHLMVSGDYEVVIHDGDDTWFGEAMQTLEDKQ